MPHSAKKRKTEKQAAKPSPPAEAEDGSSADGLSDSGSDDGVQLEDEYDLDAASSASESELQSENDNENDSDNESNGSDDSDNLSDLLASKSASKKRKRNDPAVFSTTMSKILSSHLTTTARKDPVLVRAKHSAAQADEVKLEAKARRVLRDERRKEMEKGRIRDVVPEDDEGARKALEMERRLKKTAQRGIVL
jgi:Rrp15p